MTEGKFFMLRSKLNELVLTIQGNVPSQGQPVVLMSSRGRDSQLWYEDRFSNVIRSKMDDNYCIEASGDGLTVGQYMPEEYNQHFRISGDVIRHTDDSDRVFDVRRNCMDEGAEVIIYDYNGGDNQLWEKEHVQPKYFFIRSEMHGRVVDVDRGGTDAGTKVCMWKQKEEENENQLFWEDKYGNIRSKLNDMVLDTTGGQSARLEDYDPDIQGRNWIKAGRKIINKNNPDLVLDIRGADSSKGARLVEYEYSAQANQHWIFDYIN